MPEFGQRNDARWFKIELMQVTAITTIAPSNERFSENLPGTVAALINSLADAGLPVTGADVTSAHALARLVTRAAAVYQFYRDEAYKPVHLVEFSDLADQGPTVFQIGNGPLRNIDGENLQAPRMEIKVPVAIDAVRRRQSSISELEARGYDVDASVPPVLGIAEAQLRPADELRAMMRTQSLVGHIAGLVLAGETPETDDLVSIGRELMSPRERDFLREVGSMMAPGARFSVSSSLYDEALVHLTATAAAEALAWVIGRISVPGTRLNAVELEPVAWRITTLRSGDGQVKSVDECVSALDVAHLLHHSQPGWLDEEGQRIARGWNRALGWALWPAGQWGQTERVI
ncbi:DUF4272 domain-containing protein [Corynebacterium lubricantis]|uniref:DUF4272 domain-containing protein n=1 Tax=Corynebacterium lubricantis TaxID=541095 RepID=UPI0012E9AB2E|nr:DUF4272 domain-containing protein [Corynebacterium lubricantis]